MDAIALIFENDTDIIREYMEGNSEVAANSFVRKYQKFVYATALRYLKNYEDAEDTTQEVFIKALANLPNFRGDSNIKTWLYRITANLSNNLLKKRKLYSFFTRADYTEEYFNIPSGSVSPHQSIEDKEFASNFRKVLALLPQKQRETFALRYFDNLPYEEISKMLGTSVGGLKANYHQAVKKIAEHLKKNKENFDGK